MNAPSSDPTEHAVAPSTNNGFPNIQEYLETVMAWNEQLVLERQDFLNDPNSRLQDQEIPNKWRGHFLVECADGRNALVLFIPPEQLLNRFDYEWRPVAGTIIFPEIKPPKAAKEMTEWLEKNPELREKYFSRLDFLFGSGMKRYLADYRAGKLAHIHLEFQGHFDEHNAHHGCGAHGSDLAKVQLETVKNCLLAEAWAQERFPEEYKAGVFRIYRTIHSTGEGMPVISGRRIDATAREKAQEYAGIFDEMLTRFIAPSQYDPEKGIVRAFQGNPTGIETEEHDEQIIRISNLHFAHTIIGQSVLEISWIEDADILFSHVNVLHGIIGKNYKNRNPDKPIIIHLDVVKGSPKMMEVCTKLHNLIKKNGLQAEILVTETDPETYQTTVLQ